MVIEESTSAIGLMRLIRLMRLIGVTVMLSGLTMSVTGQEDVVHIGTEDQCSGDPGFCWSDGSACEGWRICIFSIA